MINYNPFSLEGKTILVTGASSGIGRSIAIECSKMGANVIITGRNEDRLEETKSMLSPGNHLSIIADLKSSDDCKKLAENIPTIDGLVNNAGISAGMEPVPFIREVSINDVFRVNIIAPILLTKILTKKRILKNGGSIVFTSSISGMGIGAPGLSLYSTTKGAINAFMKNAALDLAAKHIRCNAVLPGMVETPLKNGKSTITEKQWEENMKLYPLKRFGRPEDVAYAVVYLLSDAASWVTGTELVIDGGRKLK